MTQSQMEPEYLLAEKSARIYPQWDHSRTSDLISLDLAQVKLRQLYVVSSLQVDISERIRDLVRELEQSLEEQR